MYEIGQGKLGLSPEDKCMNCKNQSKCPVISLVGLGYLTLTSDELIIAVCGMHEKRPSHLKVVK